MKTIFYLLIILFPIILFNCSDPVSPIPDVDPELIGEWYKIDTASVSSPAPNISFSGIQITGDKKLKHLGIETSTGRVAILNDYSRNIKKANLNKIIFEYYIEGMQITDTNYYQIENNRLIIGDNYLQKVYTRTEIGTKIFEPVNSNLSVNIDSTFYDNEKVSNYPSAYVSRISENELILNAEMNYTYLTIKVNDFIGTGTYEIAFSEGEINIFSGDVGEIFISDSVSTGIITIIEYDELNSICYGTFSFNAIANYDSTTIKEVREGIFSVPIYK